MSTPPPITRRAPVTDVLHGDEVIDPYRWLEAGSDPEVQAWMDAQDRWARAQLAALPARGMLVERLRALFYVDSLSAPTRRGSRYFSRRSSAAKEKSFLVVRDGADDERVLLDPNTWLSGDALGTWSPSWDGSKLAFSRRPNAADEAVLYVLDVESGLVSTADRIEGARYATPHWTTDNLGFYYEWIPMDAAISDDQRPGRIEIRYHRLGDDPALDQVVVPCLGDPTVFQMASLSEDSRYLFITRSFGWNRNDVYVIDRQASEPALLPLLVGRPHHYQILEYQGYFYLHTDEGAPRARILRAPVSPLPGGGEALEASWQEVVAEDPEATLEGWSIAGGCLSLAWLRRAVSELQLRSLDGAEVRNLPLPMPGAASVADGHPDDDEAWYSFSSITMPPRLYRVSVRSGRSTLELEQKLPVDSDRYVVETATARSRDGAEVPMFVVRRRDLAWDGQRPTVLYGYGGFRISLTPSFRPSLFPWLDAGGVYVVANLRGGGELGAEWHDAGKLQNKQNVFDDFIAVAESLIARGITCPARIGIWGGSNGGLLMGAAMTQRPELFGAVVSAVPLLDMLRFHLSGSGRTWISEYGCAEDPEAYQWLRAWSPYQHVVSDTRYPPLLMLSADHDDRVDPSHARKFVALMQAAAQNTGAVPPLLRIERAAGHGGADQVAERVASSADTWAWLFYTLGAGAPATAGQFGIP